MKKLYSFYWDCGRQGELGSVFIASEEEVSNAMGKDIYFGEVLGKHSEIYGDLEPKDLTILSEDQDLIEKLLSIPYFSCGTLSGYNPLTHINEDN